MTRDDPIEIPPIYPSDTIIEAGPILRRGNIPNETLLPGSITLSILKSRKQLRPKPGLGTLPRLTELLESRQIEEQIGLDQSPIGFVVEDQFLVGMTRQVLVFEFLIELRIHGHLPSIFRRPQIWEFEACCLGVFFSFLG